MRLHVTLLQIAVLASVGCGGSTLSPPASTDAGKGPEDAGKGPEDSGHGNDAAADGGLPEAACGGCNCGSPAVTSGNATAAQACSIAQPDYNPEGACSAFCSQLNGGGSGGNYFCTLPSDYTTAYQEAQTDAGDAGDAGPACPPWSGAVVVQCGYACLGRRTDGVADSAGCAGAAPGPLLAERAYLEAVSVHAFARLERELAAHGASPALLREARRARRDEVRHTAMMTRLARRFGGIVRLPEAPPEWPVRTLFAIALENAVEGCVRETYGAVVGMVEARTSADGDVRRAMRSISTDECRHAELAWAVASWILPKLTSAEREAIDRATEDTVAMLAREGDTRIVSLLASRVWKTAAPEALSVSA